MKRSSISKAKNRMYKINDLRAISARYQRSKLLILLGTLLVAAAIIFPIGYTQGLWDFSPAEKDCWILEGDKLRIKSECRRATPQAPHICTKRTCPTTNTAANTAPNIVGI